MWMGGNGNANLINAIITMIISAVGTFVAMLVIGFEDPIDETKPKVNNTINTVQSPVEGHVIDLNDVNDEMFSGEVLGKGIAVIPVSYTHLDVYKRQVLDRFHSNMK